MDADRFGPAMLDSMLKALVKAWFPNLFATLKNVAGELRVDEMEPLVFEDMNGTVASGPFAGMRYIRQSNGSPLIPKLLGTYERELHPVLRRTIARPYELVLDVGCAEGYYAVGLARAIPHARVRAYDVDPSALANLTRLAELNGVSDRIETAGWCDAAELARAAGRRTLLFCDIEGGERELLDPERAPSLKGMDVIVEIHDGPEQREIHDLLAARFAPTHRITFVPHEPRTATDCDGLRSVMRRSNRLQAIKEGRWLGTEWGVFEVW